MKGKTNIGIELSKTEMLAIGTEVEILDSLNGYAGVVYRCKLPKGKQVMINSNKVDITDYSPYILPAYYADVPSRIFLPRNRLCNSRFPVV